MSSYNSRSVTAQLAHRVGWKCIWCGRTMTPLPRGALQTVDSPTVDHLIPRSRGGLDHQNNMLLSCWTCNFDRKATAPTKYARMLLRAGKDVQLDRLVSALALLERKLERGYHPDHPLRCYARKELCAAEGLAEALERVLSSPSLTALDEFERLIWNRPQPPVLGTAL